MKCAWKELMAILPPHLRSRVDDKYRDSLQELRLRLGKPVQLIHKGHRGMIEYTAQQSDLTHIVNAASRYSPWIGATSAAGYITAPGGHRIGLCGEAVVQEGRMTGFRTLRSLNIRVARDLPQIGKELGSLEGSILILGSPGSGKTTLLRDLIRQRSKRETVAVVDERGELFPSRGDFDCGQATDILTGCSKGQGIETLLRTMGPDTIAVDEITAAADCQAMLQACWCGVQLLATAHAGGREDLYAREIYQPLIRSGAFSYLVILSPEQSWHLERMKL